MVVDAVTGPRPFRFGVQSFVAESSAEWLDRARRVEDLGYSSLHTSDHYFGPGRIVDTIGHPPVDLGPVAAMTSAAAVTSVLKVGCRVFCVDYHHPVVLAKEAATVDLMSDGRLEMGLGAGWVAAEYEGLGLEMDSAGTRIARLEEAIEVITAHFGGEPVEQHGEHYRIGGFRGRPLPPRGMPPLMVGGGGPKILSLAGRRADIVSINFDNRAGRVGQSSVEGSTTERTLQKVAWVREAAGDRFADIELETSPYFLAVTDHPASALDGLVARFGVDPEVLRDNPHVLVGSVAQIVEALQERRELLGFSYITVPGVHIEAFAPVVAELTGT